MRNESKGPNMRELLQKFLRGRTLVVATIIGVLAMAGGAAALVTVGPLSPNQSRPDSTTSTTTAGGTSPGESRIGLLTRPRTSSDDIPREVLAGPLGEYIAQPDSSRLGYRDEGASYYVVKDVDPSLCIVAVTTSDASMSCDEDPLGGNLFISYGDSDGLVVAGVAVDGYKKATLGTESVRVTDNLYVFPERPPSAIPTEVTLTTSSGSSTSVDIGKSVP
jgi:hypothetical protein